MMNTTVSIATGSPFNGEGTPGGRKRPPGVEAGTEAVNSRGSCHPQTCRSADDVVALKACVDAQAE
jgi:hypothetical protein